LTALYEVDVLDALSRSETEQLKEEEEGEEEE